MGYFAGISLHDLLDGVNRATQAYDSEDDDRSDQEAIRKGYAMAQHDANKEF